MIGHLPLPLGHHRRKRVSRLRPGGRRTRFRTRCWASRHLAICSETFSRTEPGASVLPTFTGGIFAFSPPLPQADEGLAVPGSGSAASAGITPAMSATAADAATAVVLARICLRLCVVPVVREDMLLLRKDRAQ